MWKILLLIASTIFLSEQCKYHWQCSSLLCESGRCVEKDSLESKPKKLYSLCENHSDCFSGCCSENACSPSLLCEAECRGVSQCENTLSQEKIKQTLLAARASINFRQIDAMGKCNYNLECKSGCCFEGVCSSESCEHLEVSNEFCYYSADCQSNCCIDNECCDTDDCYQGLLNSTPCQFNYHCSDGCCQNGHCSLNHQSCLNQKKLGNFCLNNEECGSSCCQNKSCGHSAHCFNQLSLLREDTPSQAIFYSYILSQRNQLEQKSLRANTEIIYNEESIQGVMIWALLSFIMLFMIILIVMVSVQECKEEKEAIPRVPGDLIKE